MFTSTKRPQCTNNEIKQLVAEISEYFAEDKERSNIAIELIKETKLDEAFKLFQGNTWVYTALSRVLDKHKGKMILSAKKIEEDFLAFLEQEIVVGQARLDGLKAFFGQLRGIVSNQLNITESDYEIAQALQQDGYDIDAYDHNKYEKREHEQLKNDNAFNAYKDLEYWYQELDLISIGEIILKDKKDVVFVKALGRGHRIQSGNSVDAKAVLESKKAKLDSGKRLIGLYNTGGNHWIAFIVFKDSKGKLGCRYKDSLGQGRSDFKKDLEEVFVEIDVKCLLIGKVEQIEPSLVHCGIFALKNMDILANCNTGEYENVEYYTPESKQYEAALKVARREYALLYAQRIYEELKQGSCIEDLRKELGIEEVEKELLGDLAKRINVEERLLRGDTESQSREPNVDTQISKDKDLDEPSSIDKAKIAKHDKVKPSNITPKSSSKAKPSQEEGTKEHYAPIKGEKESPNKKATLPPKTLQASPEVNRAQTTNSTNVPNSLTNSSSMTYGASGLKNSLHGNIYQLKLLMLFMHRAIQNDYEFCLATEMDAAEKFDDLVFKYKKSGETVYTWRYLQAKHKQKQNDKETIKDADLLSADGDFSLQKYFISYCRIKEDPLFKGDKLGEFTICTNIGLDGQSELKEALQEMRTQDLFLNCGTDYKKAKCYKFDRTKGTEKLKDALMKTSELTLLAKELATAIKGGKRITLKNQLFKEYHYALVCEGIVDIQSKKLCGNFIINDKKLNKQAKLFREEFIKILSPIPSETLELSSTFGKKPNGDRETTRLSDIKCVSEKEIGEFLEHLVLAVNQPNEIELGKVIAKELGDRFHLEDNDFIYSKFLEAALDWMKEKQGKYINQEGAQNFFDVMKRPIHSLMLAGSTLQHTKELEGYGIAFKSSNSIQGFIDESNIQIMLYQVSGPIKLGEIKVLQTLKGIQGYEKTDSYVFISTKTALAFKDQIANVFRQDALLVLVYDDKSELGKLGTLLQGLFSSIEEKKLILMVSDAIGLTSVIPHNVRSETINAKTGFFDLTQSSQDKIRNKEVIFQGNTIKLDKLLSEGSLDKVIDANSLMELIKDDKVSIGESLPPIYPLYIDRELKRAVVLKNECISVPDIFVIDNIKKEELNKLLPKENSSQEEYSKRCILGDTEEAKSKLAEARKNNSKAAIHWLSYVEGKFTWQKSEGALSSLRSYIIKEDVHSIPQDKFELNYNIISAEPGIGKSTIIPYLASQLDKGNNVWIQNVNLIEYKDKLKSRDHWDINNILEFISQNNTTALSKKVLEYCITTKGRAAFFFDGFDEISPAQQEQTIKILLTLKEAGVDKILVTTRHHKRERLEDALSVFAHEIKPFNEKDRLDFILKYWKEKLKFKESVDAKVEGYAKQLIEVFTKATTAEQNNFIAIPLQAKLLAEAFLQEAKEFYEGNVLHLPEKLDINDLYKHFINKKFDIYLNEKSGIYIPSDKEPIRTIFLECFNKAHQRLACNLIFPELEIKNDNKLKGELISVGIAQLINNEMIFIHRTFAEYFVATLLAKYLQKSPGNTKYTRARDFLIRNIFKSSNNVILTFLKNMIKSVGQDRLSQELGDIFQKDLLPYTNNHSCLKISYPRQRDNADDLKKPEPPNVDFSTLQSKLESFASNMSELPGLSELCDEVLKRTEVEELEKLLSILGDIIKTTVITNAKEIIESYSIKIKLKILSPAIDLSKMKVVLPFEDYYKAINAKDNAILRKGLRKRELLIYLYCFHPNFSIGEIELIKKLYDESDKVDYRNLNLFLKINKDDTEVLKNVLDFLINKSDAYLLCEFLSQFTNISFNTDRIDNMYNRNDSTWLERHGIELVSKLKILTTQMADNFKLPISMPEFREHFGTASIIIYANKIWDCINTVLSSHVDDKEYANIDKAALIGLCEWFISFSKESRLESSVCVNRLETILGFMGSIGNANHIKECTNALYTLLSASSLKAIDAGVELILILDTQGGFEYEMKITNKESIVNLLKDLAQRSKIASDIQKG